MSLIFQCSKLLQSSAPTENQARYILIKSNKIGKKDFSWYFLGRNTEKQIQITRALFATTHLDYDYEYIYAKDTYANLIVTRF